MCIGESANDTLQATDRQTIAEFASRDFPAHDMSFECNSDGMVWAIFAPRTRHSALPRVTICRIDPCIMVLIEDAQARRQIRSLPTIGDALNYGRLACAATLDAAAGVPSLAVH